MYHPWEEERGHSIPEYSPVKDISNLLQCCYLGNNTVEESYEQHVYVTGYINICCLVGSQWK